MRVLLKKLLKFDYDGAHPECLAKRALYPSIQFLKHLKALQKSLRMSASVNVFVLGVCFLLVSYTIVFSYRDPFFIPSKQKNITQNKNNILPQEQKITLIGVVEIENSFGAILEKKGEREVIFLSDKVWNFYVKEITFDHVILLKGDKRIKIPIRS